MADDDFFSTRRDLEIAGFMTHPTAAQLASAHAGRGMRTMGGHTVGAPDGGPGLSGTGWSTAHGDLRIPHFIGLHALQVLPLIAFMMRRRRLSGDTRVRVTLTAAGSYFTLVVLLLIQALRGQPILRPEAPAATKLSTPIFIEVDNHIVCD